MFGTFQVVGEEQNPGRCNLDLGEIRRTLLSVMGFSRLSNNEVDTLLLEVDWIHGN